MSKEDSKHKGIRIGLAIAIVILVLLGIIQLFLRFYLDSYIENRLTSAVDKQTNGQYELVMEDLNLSVWNQSIEMENIRLHPVDTASTAPKLDLGRFSINEIRFFPYLFRGNIEVGQIQLSEPSVSFVQNSRDSLTFLQSSDRTSGRQKSRTIEADQLKIDNGSVIYWKPNQTGRRGELNDFDLAISEIRVDSTSRSTSPFFNFSAIQTSSGKIRYELNSGLYAIETNGIDFSTIGNRASVDSLKLIPQLPKYEFTQKIGHQLDRIELTIEKLLLENPDIEKLNSGELKAEKFTIEKANLDVFHSKLLPPGPKKEKVFPQVAFKNLKFPVSIDTIKVNQSEISYSEHLPDVSRPGTVTFANVNATFTDVTNDSAAISRGHTVVLDVTSEVMHEALLDVHFEIPMHLNGSHTARGTLESMAAEALNPVLAPIGLVRAERGMIHSLQFLLDLNDAKASGWVQLVYSDLKLEILDAENVNEGGRQRFKTWLANLLKVKNNNNKAPLRRGEVSFERSEKKSIFNYWWKSLSSGLKDNIGL